MLDDFNVEAIRKEVHAFYGRKEYPTLTACLVFLKIRIYFKVDVLLYGRYCVKWDSVTRNTKTSSIYMSSRGSFNNVMTISVVCDVIIVQLKVGLLYIWMRLGPISTMGGWVGGQQYSITSSRWCCLEPCLGC